MKLSVIIPAYNEENTIAEIIKRVAATGLAEEIVVVNDGSTDKTSVVLAGIKQYPNLRILDHAQNAGKGAAVISGLKAAQGDVFIIQDADLEYDPRDYANLLAPVENGEADVVFGSRFTGMKHEGMLILSALANRFITIFANFLFGSRLTDVETCYKLFTRPVAERLDLRSRGFELEPEFTAKVLKMKVRIREVPISYNPRGYGEGKKIQWIDGVKTLWTLLKYRFSS